MVKTPPGTKTIVAPSRSPTIARGQPEAWIPASLLAVKPWGSGLAVTGTLALRSGELAMARGEGRLGVSSAGLAGSVRLALPPVCFGWATTTWGGAGWGSVAGSGAGSAATAG